MPLATRVNLPKTQRPAFPDRCVSCGKIRPGHLYAAHTRAIGWWTVVLMMDGSKWSAEVPACQDCACRLRTLRRRRVAIDQTVMAAAVIVWLLLINAFVVPVSEWIVVPVWKWMLAAWGMVVTVSLPLALWQPRRPPAFDMTAYRSSVDYEFLDPAYAEEFALLNTLSEPD